MQPQPASQRPRLTITLNGELLQALDQSIDGDLLRNRSQAIEHYLKEGLGANRLQAAFFFFVPGWLPSQLEDALDLCATQRVGTIFLCLPGTDAVLSQAVQAVATAWQQGHLTPEIQFHTVPADFGSGAALLLQQKQLEESFLLCWVGPGLQLPASLLAPLLFHRGHGATLTILQVAQNSAFVPSGLAISQPGILAQIPAGVSDLQADIFPLLAKLGTVRGYVLPPR